MLPKNRGELEAMIAAPRRGEFPEIVRTDAFVGQLLESRVTGHLPQPFSSPEGLRLFFTYKQASVFLAVFGVALSLIEVQPMWRQSSVVYLIHWRSEGSWRTARRIQSPK